MVYRVGQRRESAPGRPPLSADGRAPPDQNPKSAYERAFLQRLGASPAFAAHVVAEARWLATPADIALLATRQVSDDDFYRAIAAALGVPFVTQGVRIASGIDYESAARSGMAPLAAPCGGRRWLLAPRGAALIALAAQGNSPDFAITTPRRFGSLLRLANAERIAEDAGLTVEMVEPGLTARDGPTRVARLAAALAGLALVSSTLAWPFAVGAISWVLLAIGFSAATVVRLFMTAMSGQDDCEDPPLPDRRLPEYTVVIALYREAAMVAGLVRALEQIDYPRAKLDIKFVVETDDRETFAALAAMVPGVEYEIIVAPPGAPRTKPRALDVALPFARGELLTVYDAEDIPEPDQLRRAAARFARAGEKVACLQARLAIDNGDDSWLTGLYAIDYASLFEAANPGVAALDLPMLLGGTSNHFRTAILRKLGGWDAWNVTEDADLGIRLARRGYRVETINSRTYEEAPNTLAGFLHQRERWMKGWMQTAFVHLHNPLALWRDLRPLAFFTTISVFISGVVSPLLWPFFFILLLFDVATGSLFAAGGWVELVSETLACSLAIAGPIATLWPAFIGMRKQRLAHLWPRLLLYPFWYLLLSVAAWRAVLDLWRNPFRWAKTTHGVARARVRRSGDRSRPARRPSRNVAMQQIVTDRYPQSC